MSVNETAPSETEEPAKKSKKLLLVVAVAVLAAAAGAWWFMIRPASAEAAPQPGVVVPLDSVQVNLAGGHYLKIGVALQAVEGVEEVDGSKALDATIELFTGTSMDDLANPRQREKLKTELEHQLDELYDGEVMGVYFTDFVTQ